MKKLITTLTVSMAIVTASTMVEANTLKLSHTVVDVSNAAELNNVFDTTQLENVQALELSNQEMKETEGALINFAVGGAIGFGTYAATNYYLNKPITWQGSLYSVGTGALTGGVGSALGRAAGGGIGNVVWKANGMSLNAGLGTYRNYRNW